MVLVAVRCLPLLWTEKKKLGDKKIGTYMATHSWTVYHFISIWITISLHSDTCYFLEFQCNGSRLTCINETKTLSFPRIFPTFIFQKVCSSLAVWLNGLPEKTPVWVSVWGVRADEWTPTQQASGNFRKHVFSKFTELIRPLNPYASSFPRICSWKKVLLVFSLEM